MKTAISLPNVLYHEAEEYARRTGLSRSRLFAEAVAEYLQRHAPDRITDSMNAVLAKLDKTDDGFAREAAARLLREVEW